MKIRVTAMAAACLLVAGITGVQAGWQWTEVDSVFNTTGLKAHQRGMYVCDLEADGDADIIYSNHSSSVGPGLLCYRNTGCTDHPVYEADTALFYGIHSIHVHMADLDGDSLDDLITDTVVYRNTGSASAPVWSRYKTYGELGLDSTGAPWFGDLDGDGDLDAVGARWGLDRAVLTFHKNRSSGDGVAFVETTLAVTETLFVDWTSVDAPPFCVDADSDGDLDIAFSSIILDSRSVQYHVLWNQGNWHFTYDESSMPYVTEGRIVPFAPCTGNRTAYYETNTAEVLLYADADDSLRLHGGEIISDLKTNGRAAAAVVGNVPSGNFSVLATYTFYPVGPFGGWPISDVQCMTRSGSGWIKRYVNLPEYMFSAATEGAFPIKIFDFEGDGSQEMLFTNSGDVYSYTDGDTGAGRSWVSTAALFDYFDTMNVHDANPFDFDGDSVLDLFVRMDSVYRWFGNNGTDDEPEWNAQPDWGAFSDAGITLAAVVELNGYGDAEIIFGMDDGTLTCFRNTGTTSSPVWAEDSSVFAGIDVGASCTPCFVDYDGDGDLDLITGNRDGELAYHSNESTAGILDWTRQPVLISGMSVRRNPARTSVTVGLERGWPAGATARLLGSDGSVRIEYGGIRPGAGTRTFVLPGESGIYLLHVQGGGMNALKRIVIR